MGPTWIVVVVVVETGETTVTRHSFEDDARAAYDVVRELPGRTVYLATVRSEART
jgi:hypothetical protein